MSIQASSSIVVTVTDAWFIMASIPVSPGSTGASE